MWVVDKELGKKKYVHEALFKYKKKMSPWESRIRIEKKIKIKSIIFEELYVYFEW